MTSRYARPRPQAGRGAGMLAAMMAAGTMVATTGERAKTDEVASGRHVWQPVQEYFATTDDSGTVTFIPYTHIGTDFGRLGDPRAITVRPGMVEVRANGGPAGLWHSLAGLGRERGEVLDFGRCRPRWIAERWQARIVGMKIRARGAGMLRVELKDANERTIWDRRMELADGPWEDFRAVIDPAGWPGVKFLNWTVESGGWGEVDGVWLEVEMPPLDYDEEVFAVSYGKLSRCYSESAGLVRDRAHFESGAFDSIPASGMFCLATAVAWRSGGVSEAFARDVLRRTHAIVAPLASRHGLLPHFACGGEAGWRICPGTEFSTVDSAIYLHSMRLAARIIGDSASERGIEESVRRIDFRSLRDADGYIVHGTAEDGTSLLTHAWRDWGGESALVLLLARMAEGDDAVLRMHADGRVFGGVGFIAELQSLFFPQFDVESPDALTGVSWRGVRGRLLAAQREYVGERFPESRAARLGAYGLSAGEGRGGRGYAVAGVELPSRGLLHPHYMLMSASLAGETSDVYRRLWQMEEAGWFTAWGMVENIAVETDDYLPMNGSLNAAFESLGAYHALVNHRGGANLIYEAARSSVAFREAARLFATR